MTKLDSIPSISYDSLSLSGIISVHRARSYPCSWPGVLPLPKNNGMLLSCTVHPMSDPWYLMWFPKHYPSWSLSTDPCPEHNQLWPIKQWQQQQQEGWGDDKLLRRQPKIYVIIYSTTGIIGFHQQDSIKNHVFKKLWGLFEREVGWVPDLPKPQQPDQYPIVSTI